MPSGPVFPVSGLTSDHIERGCEHKQACFTLRDHIVFRPPSDLPPSELLGISNSGTRENEEVGSLEI